ncbi:alpha/beta hydrolase [Dyadobacter sp. 32]|uniref:alpha/beta hydrolase n=1 Tax=Dyadobacter sp. 32 TaxID=538966 RepID=UPI0039C6820E
MKPEIRPVLGIALFISLVFILSGCSFRRIKRTKNIVYATSTSTTSPQQLNIFAPRKYKKLNDVIVFIHGGNWNSGRKEQYNIIGKNWAKKGVVYVIIDYPLSPAANYRDMAIASAKSVKWVKDSIRHYGGNPERIFVSGHSAGGHLASLISLDNKYFKDLGSENPIAGTILIDAGGLDMYGYLMDEKISKDDTYFKTFTGDPENWKDASPLHHLHKKMPPMVIYQGGKTYPSIVKSTARFVKALDEFAPETPFHLQKSKKHVPMITQYLNPWNRRYKKIIGFMKEVK